MILKRDFIYTPKNAPRTAHIWLPEGWETSGQRYPVMYFFDGHNLFSDADATYGKSWGMSEFLSNWEKEIIVVGIECGHDGDERLSEYLPYPANKSSWFGKYEPMGMQTLQWILDEIKPVIDRDYPTIPFRECTAIGGSSMGGIMALCAAVHFNRWFSKAACVSTAMGFCQRPLLADLRASDISPDTRVFLSWGTNEAHGITDPTKEDRSSKTYGWNQKAAEMLRSRGADVRLYCQVGGYHCEASWETQVPLFMNYLWTE